MSDELLLNGKKYVSSKRAAEQTGYARDYIGQLSRGGLIDAERVGGLWYVSMESLQGYEKNAETARSFSPATSVSKEADSALSFEGKEYISASRASKITGYNQDYVGQLARASKIPSRQIGNRWYVDREALVAHKAEKDALLAAVQSEAVGLKQAVEQQAVTTKPAEHILVLPQMQYVQESADLLPHIPEKTAERTFPLHNYEAVPLQPRPATIMSEIRPAIAPVSAPSQPPVPQVSILRPKKRSRRVSKPLIGVLTIILVLSVGLVSMKQTGTLTQIQESGTMEAMTAGAAQTVGGIGDIIENWVSPLLVYERGH